MSKDRAFDHESARAPITSGPDLGLTRVTFRFEVRVYGSLQAYRVRLIDDIQRLGLYSVVLP